ncbi:lachesin [Ixodes scapularis]|uniref:lachesin n=1 Tax=Ixodes scapularis TaxID=6945 RepID=UPI001A9CE93C|nr:lachesin [Ixodes scapularis]
MNRIKKRPWGVWLLTLALSVLLKLHVKGDVDDLREEELPPYFAEVIPNVTVPRGRDARIPCVIDNLGSYRPAWIKVEDKGILSIHQQVISRNYRISLSTSDNRNFVLHIKNVQESDKGGYMCQINTSPMMSQVGYLDVLVPPDIVVEESSSDVVVREGSNVTLICKAKGYPRPTISWRREDNEPIPLGSWKNGKKTQTLVQTYEGEFLTVTRVSRVHMGAYLCIANNNVPSPVSRRIMLHVHFPPVIWIPNQLVGAPPRTNVTLDCHSEAYPPAVNYWAKEGHKIFLNNDKFLVSVRKIGYKTHMQLTVRQLREHDFGAYKCLSENLLGATEGSVNLYELPMEKHRHGRNRTAFHQLATLGKLSPHSRQQQSLDSQQADKHPYGRNSYHDGKYFASEDSYSDEDDSHDETSRYGPNNGPSTFSIALAALLVAQFPVALLCL